MSEIMIVNIIVCSVSFFIILTLLAVIAALLRMLRLSNLRLTELAAILAPVKQMANTMRGSKAPGIADAETKNENSRFQQLYKIKAEMENYKKNDDKKPGARVVHDLGSLAGLGDENARKI